MSHGLTLGQDVLDRLMPMHLCVADCGLIHSAGPTMRKLMPPDAQDVEDVFVEGRGAASGHVIGAIRAAKGGNRLALRLRHHRRLSLRGHVVAPGFGGLLLNFCFGVSLSEAVAVFGLTESDFAPSELALELMFLQEANRAVQQELARFNRHLMLARKDAEREAHTDALTGLLNRPAFLRALEDAVDEAAQADRQFGFLMIEPDHHHQLLGDIGLDHADDLLAAAAERLRGLIGDSATAARYAGHTLAVLLPGADYHATAALADRIRDGFSAQLFEIGARSSVVSVSIGGVQIGEKIANVGQVLARATRALESASGTGGNRSEIFDPGATDRVEEERIQAWVARLRGALDNDGFLLHYQPVINLQGDTAAVYEILLRLDGGDELIAPGAFLSIAEDNGMLGEIDRYVVGRAIAAIGQRLREHRPTTLLVKVSQASLDDEGLAEFIGAQLAAHQVPGEYLVLQLPESKVFTHLKAAQAFAANIGRFDCRFALEQFGVGLDSFQLLTHLQPHLLKIDRSFTDDLAGNAENQERIAEIARRARQIGIRTIAEFVQDATSMSILFAADIDYVQGNFLAAAGPGMNYDFE